MRSLSVILVIALVLTLTLAFAPCASAEETKIDWENYDWDSFQGKDLEDEEWESLADWLRTDADISRLFFVFSHADGWVGELLDGVLADRFMADPEEVIYEIAKQNKDAWQFYVGGLVILGITDRPAFIALLESVTLSGPNAEKGYQVLAKMIASAEEEYNTEITNPKTGDPVGVAVALLALSGIGSGLMIWKKKSSRYAA